MRSFTRNNIPTLVIKNMMFANMTNIDWQLGDVTTSAKGIRSAPLMDGKNNSLHFQLTTPDKPLYAPFGASAYTILKQSVRAFAFECTKIWNPNCATWTLTWAVT